jgi:3-oxoacyl-[acyl-carrier-protein] synthase-1
MPAARIVEVDPADPIFVTARGMVSSLGLNASTSCAAARANIRRAQPLDSLRLASLDGRLVEPATGHPAPFITHGFEGTPRLSQLAAAALRDLISSHPRSLDGNAGFYLSLPSCRRHLSGAELIPDEAAKAAFLGRVKEESVRLDDRFVAETVFETARLQSGIPRDIPVRFVTHAGHSGFAEALSTAANDLQRRAVDIAIVGGVDSLVDERSLKWLKITGRLKSEANPAGLEPGEGAAFVAIGRGNAATGGGGRPLCAIRKIVIADEDRSRIAGDEPTGQALSRCVTEAIDPSEQLWLVTDHNGETVRAMEFGNAVMRVTRHNRNWLQPLLLTVSFGDTGAASAALAVCVVEAAFARDYAPAHTAVIASIADGCQRAALSVGRM